MVILIVSVFVAFLYYQHAGRVALRAAPANFLLHRSAFRRDLSLGLLWRRANATAAVCDDRRGFLLVAAAERDSLPSWSSAVDFPAVGSIPWLHAVQEPISTRASWPGSSVWSVMIIVSLLTTPPPQRKADAHHLEPQLRQARRKSCDGNTRVEGFPHLVGLFVVSILCDLRIFLLVQFLRYAGILDVRM